VLVALLTLARAPVELEQSDVLGRTGRARGPRYVLRYQGG